jgi:multidrug efflux pump subunit AcrB
MVEMSGALRLGLLMAVGVILLLLAANFQSLRLSLAVGLTIPAVIAGVVLMLWLTGTTLNIQFNPLWAGSWRSAWPWQTRSYS